MPNRAFDRKPVAAPPHPLILGPERFDAANRRRLSGPGLRTFLGIADSWGLTEVERLRVLGCPGRSTYHGWVAKARAGGELTLPVDVLLRISAVLGVHKGLRIVFRTDEEGTGWLKRPHRSPAFGEQPPLALITGGTQDGIMLVRRYLDAWRGGTFAAPDAADGEVVPLSGDDIVIL